ncbi:hypothetical protein AJ80_06249 [Polytolypa hystricis UAMH7299]|uniref:Calcium channel YVC1-like C-terminal transmembrane domain-containing protein n=1 Tax=Polytolypa hystricis (strain UAMH7299) TaxID=1447883 RepID=A0A2B7XYR6_POLH7|nr:hypothetical protein AJ80_06249 [Polytolypa hystricis UAMH7299]
MAVPNMRPSTSSSFVAENSGLDIPIIDHHESVADIVRKLHNYLVLAISDTAYSFDHMRALPPCHPVKTLIASLSDNVHNPAIISALMILKWQFAQQEDDNWGLNESRGYACEYVSWQFVTFLSPRQTIEFLLTELSGPTPASALEGGSMATLPFEQVNRSESQEGAERIPLLRQASSSLSHLFGYGTNRSGDSQDMTSEEGLEQEVYAMFSGLNALEIATISTAKKFLSQKPVQRVVNDVWRGAIVLWDNLSVHSKRKPLLFNKRISDPYSRLRVPVYRKTFEAMFFISFLVLYYAVLVERNPFRITSTEAFLYVWIAAFAYDELGGILDAGVLFYGMDFWSLWDLGIVGTGVAFLVTRLVGLGQGSDSIIDLSFDILSLEALFLVPRLCSLMSLNPYFGSLIPVLKEMTKAFLKFLPIVAILYIGFLTTFTMLARDRLSFREMSWILVKVFFGSSYLGFVSDLKPISPLFGYPLMLVFVCLTNILLISSVISLMSLSLTEIMAHAREEYLFQLSIYVLESCSSRRLTYFLPPLNLIPLVCIRPLRLFFPSESVRRARISMLRITHLPFVAIIMIYERSRGYVSHRTQFKIMSHTTGSHLSVNQPGGPTQSVSRLAQNRSLPLAGGKGKASPTARFEAREAGSHPSADSMRLEGVEEVVNDLRTQVEHLTAAIAHRRSR